MKKSEEQMIDHLRDADHSKRSFPVTESMSAFLPAQGNFEENPQVMKNSCRIDKQRANIWDSRIPTYSSNLQLKI